MKESLKHYTSLTGRKIARRTFEPEMSEGDRGLVAGLVLVHGLGEHTGRYTAVMERLTAPGILAAGPDLPGHGFSDGKRGHIDSLETTHELIRETIDYLREQLPEGAPVGVFGHSMGGLLVLDYLKAEPGALSFAWVNAPPLNPRHGRPYVLYLAAKLINPIWPSFTISNGITPSMCFESDDADWIAKATEYCHRRLSLGLGIQLIRAAKRVNDPSREFDPDLELLLTQGEPDEVCPPEYSKAFFENLTLPHKTWRLFPGILHECWRSGEVVDAAYAWLTHTLFADEKGQPAAVAASR